MISNHQMPWVVALVALIALVTVLGGHALGVEPWLDELRETLAIYRTLYPEGNWKPYLEKLQVVKEGIDRANRHDIDTAMDEFLMMLRSQAHGINGVAAHALYWIALGLQPPGPILPDAGGKGAINDGVSL